jgi:hypothetical protein
MGANPVGASPGSCAEGLSLERSHDGDAGDSEELTKKTIHIRPKIVINPKASGPGPKKDEDKNYVLVRKPYGRPSGHLWKSYECPRTLIRLLIQDFQEGPHGDVIGSDSDLRFYSNYGGKRTLTIVQSGGPYIELQDHDGVALKFDDRAQTTIKFSAAEFPGRLEIYAVGLGPSAAIDDITLTLTLEPWEDSQHVFVLESNPADDSLTSVEVTLDICQSKHLTGGDPSVMPLPTGSAPLGDKISPGRFVHVQDSNYQHARAMLIVRASNPPGIPLDLTPLDTDKVNYYAEEVAAAGQDPVTPAPYSSEQNFWAEGSGVSGEVADTGFALGLSGLGYGDWVAMTAVQFSLQARIPATPPRTHQTLPDNTPAPHTFQVAAGAALSEDFTQNTPLVLVENSVEQVALHLDVRPKLKSTGLPIPISWSNVQRDPADDSQVIALSSGVPSMKPDDQHPGDSTHRSLSTGGVGSFHVRAYISCNADGQFQGNQDPSVVLNLVLVRVVFIKDCTVPNSTNFDLVFATGIPGVRVNSHDHLCDVSPGNSAIYMYAQVCAIGGGDRGLLGVDRNLGPEHVCAGWIQNRTESSAIGSYKAATQGTLKLKLAWTPELPLLDSAREPAGVGEYTAALMTSSETNFSSAGLGQTFVVTAYDAPDPGIPVDLDHQDDSHDWKLARVTYRDKFHTALCVWTSAAERLYSIIYQFDWGPQGDWTIDALHKTYQQLTDPEVKVEESSKLAGFVPGEQTNTKLEVRFPSACFVKADWKPL